MIATPYPRRLTVARWLFALVLGMHGAAHFLAVAGTVRSLGDRVPVELLGGMVVTSNAAVQMLLALATAAAGTGFVAAAFMVVGREPKAGPALLAVAVMSLATTVVGLWGTMVGVLIDLAVLAVVAAGRTQPSAVSVYGLRGRQDVDVAGALRDRRIGVRRRAE
jgi:hypothetical protein